MLEYTALYMDPCQLVLSAAIPGTQDHSLQAIGIPHALCLSQFNPYFLKFAPRSAFVLIHGQEFFHGFLLGF